MCRCTPPLSNVRCIANWSLTTHQISAQSVQLFLDMEHWGTSARVHMQMHTGVYHLPLCDVFLRFYRVLYLGKQIDMFHFCKLFIPTLPLATKVLKLELEVKRQFFIPFILVSKRCALMKGFRILFQNWNQITFDPMFGQKMVENGLNEIFCTLLNWSRIEIG